MIVVKVDNKKGGIERALKNYKYKVIKTKQLNNLRDGRYYEKKTKYVEKLKGSED
jgi:ribosomal protein S21